MSYSTSLTQSYNGGFIHTAILNRHEIIRVQVDPYAYVIQVNSIRAAKSLITKHVNSGRSLAFKKQGERK